MEELCAKWHGVDQIIGDPALLKTPRIPEGCVSSISALLRGVEEEETAGSGFDLEAALKG